MADEYKRKNSVELIPKDKWAMIGDLIVARDAEAKAKTDEVKRIKQNLNTSMEKASIDSWFTNNGNVIIRVKGSEGKKVKKFNEEKFMYDYPELYSKYLYEETSGARSGHIRIKSKGEE